ncbi:amidase [Pseudodonghicola flavimaris]|uniref:Amidase n=1 Tax=Pseudodonghicola flavimaris TaxID=3050036 RepID=A0ABT7EUN0_9RHOB|nr:amidase [Pseudodonghicola flavimaris]MDK3016051.1 amidase [Pseudodonghicola flavimaris]
MTKELWSWTAAELATAIAVGDVSSVEATEAALARMEAVNPALNAVVDALPDQALQDARAADAARARGEALGLLHGVPVTTKMNADYKGRATANGVVAFADLIAPEDGSAVRSLRRNGAVIIGRTNTPAFSMSFFTDNDLFGPTMNPYDPETTPAGSSGGAGAAVAAGIGALAHGSDIGGSIRLPAYVNGVFGLRPTAGILPCHNPSSSGERMVVSQVASVQGPLARCVRDVRLGLRALSLWDPRDPLQVAMPAIDPAYVARPCKVAVIREPEGCEADPEVIDAIDRAARALSEAGYTVEEVETPSLLMAADLWQTLLGNEMMSGSLPTIRKLGDARVNRLVDLMVEIAEPLDRDGFMAAFASRSTVLRQWQLLFATHPIVLTAPSWRRPYPTRHEMQPEVTGRTYLTELAPAFMPPILGLPGFSVPMGEVDGLPTGVQLLSARFAENMLLAAGEVLERSQPLVRPIEPRAARHRG